MLQSITRVTAASSLALAVIGACTASASAQSHSPNLSSHQGCTPGGGSATVLTEQCGPCLLVTFSQVSQHDTVVQALAADHSDPIWIAADTRWIAVTNPPTELGAIGCSMRLGGYVLRLVK